MEIGACETMSRRQGEHKHRRARLALQMVLPGAVVAAIGVAGFVCFQHIAPFHVSVHASPKFHFTRTLRPDRQTFLLIGTDARPAQDLGNSDVLCVASLDEAQHRIEFLSIPRDTQVAFPDGRYHKINDALLQGGPELTVRVVETLIGLPIDHYAVTRFDGLVHIIDRLGGIDINVPRRMNYNTGDKTYGQIHLHPGLQRLTGEQALGFVRFRHDALGDIGRTSRQQNFLIALKDRLLRAEAIPQLPGIAMDFMKSVDTDASAFDLARFASEAPRYAGYKTIHETLPGSFHDPNPNRPNDLSYWVVNPRQARFVAKQFFEDGVIEENPVQDPSITQRWDVPVSPATNAT